MEHLIIAPILIPAFAGMLLLLEVRERQRLRRLTGLLATLALIPVALGLWRYANHGTFRPVALARARRLLVSCVIPPHDHFPLE